jgi:hypothetical protein
MKQNNQQTAVDWLYQKLSTSSSDELVGNINAWFEQAKQIEKEQMLMFYRWMKENDTFEYAERFFHYTDEDMLNEFLKETYGK